MRFSILTPTLNSATTIIDCITSINNQLYNNLEQIIVDGKSSDNTLEIIKSMPNRVSTISSEPDEGLYDAMNKGIGLATGDIIGILNSDDLYIDNKVLQDVADLMTETGTESLFADLYYVYPDDTNRIFRYWKTGSFIPGSFSKGWHPPHPTFFVKRSVYEHYGLFDTSCKISADFELMLRFLEKHRISTCYLPRPILKMRQGGQSSVSIKNIIIGNINCYKAFKKNGIRVSPFYFLYRAAPKMLQMLNPPKSVTKSVTRDEKA